MYLTARARPRTELPNNDTVAERVMTGLSKIGIALRSGARRQAGPRGLTPTQAQILVLLRNRGRPGLRVSELADLLAITPATTSAAVSVIAGKGLARKERSFDDARARSIVLTEAGQAEADLAAEWPDLMLDAVGVLTREEQEVFLRSVVKMIGALQERRQIPIARMCVSCRFFHPNVHDDRVRPHHCAYVDAPFGDGGLRLDCHKFEEAEPVQAREMWGRFLTRSSTATSGDAADRVQQSGTGRTG